MVEFTNPKLSKSVKMSNEIHTPAKLVAFVQKIILQKIYDLGSRVNLIVSREIWA